MRLVRLFTEHPSALGESYREHMRVSLSYAVPLLGAGLAASIHGLFPFLYTTTASATVKRLYERMTKRCLACPSARLHRPDLFEPATGIAADGPFGIDRQTPACKPSTRKAPTVPTRTAQRRPLAGNA